jgi:predicted RNA-binding protein YlxR (DUF448 family)
MSLREVQRNGSERSCAVCRERGPKAKLLRFVLAVEGGGAERSVKFDFAKRLPGRGAYCCRSLACLDSPQAKAAVIRALERRSGKGGRGARSEAKPVIRRLPDELREAVRSELELLGGEKVLGTVRSREKTELENLLGRALTKSGRKQRTPRGGMLPRR